jgi:hypothetical protein
MLKEYGNNSKQFKCNKDKILFYKSYNDYIKDYCYKCKCPICNNYICYFCSFNGDNYDLSCCLKFNILKTIFQYGPRPLNEPFDKSNLFFLIIPILNIFMIIFSYFKILYIGLILVKTKNNNKEEIMQYVDLSNGKYTILNKIIICAIDALLCFPFIIIYYLGAFFNEFFE